MVMQDVPGGKVIILGGHNISLSKEIVYVHMSYSEQFLR
jgi:hypothetical protein